MVYVCLLFRNYLPLVKGVVLHLNKLESTSHKNHLFQVKLKLAQGVSKSVKEGF